MSGIDDAMGQTAEQLNEAEAEAHIRALIPRAHVYEVTRENPVEKGTETFQVVANSMNTDRDKVVFFTIRYQKPHQLVNFITRVVGGYILDVVDQGEVPESRIIH